MRLLKLTFVLAIAAVSIVAAQTKDAQIGTWKLNPAKSKFVEGMAPPKSAVTTIEAAAGGGIKVTVHNTNADGSVANYSFTAKYDGKDYPVAGDPNRDMVSYTKKDDFTFTATSKLKGKVTSTATIVYSKDGKMRTVTVTGTAMTGANAGQTGTNVQVYDRQ